MEGLLQHLTPRLPCAHVIDEDRQRQTAKPLVGLQKREGGKRGR